MFAHIVLASTDDVQEQLPEVFHAAFIVETCLEGIFNDFPAPGMRATVGNDAVEVETPMKLRRYLGQLMFGQLGCNRVACLGYL